MPAGAPARPALIFALLDELLSTLLLGAMLVLTGCITPLELLLVDEVPSGLPLGAALTLVLVYTAQSETSMRVTRATLIKPRLCFMISPSAGWQA
jgi:hypothetical protein